MNKAIKSFYRAFLKKLESFCLPFIKKVRERIEVKLKNTKIYRTDTKENFEKAVDEVSDILKNGGLAIIPTETVYGLAADGMNEKAVKGIFEAKGRPGDNPLIFHVCDFEMVNELAETIPPKAKKLMDKFWPGPLTVILPKKEPVPKCATGGLDSVAVRMPSHPFAEAVIKKTGKALTAPSANVSGKPSPTDIVHCVDDMNGKVDAIVDGGSCQVGVESTVISFLGEIPMLLRPGAVTPEEIEKEIGKIELAKAITEEVKAGEKVLSPGMKYKHYSPSAEVYIVKGSFEAYKKYVEGLKGEGIYGLVFDGEKEKLGIPALEYGGEKGAELQAHKLFYCLREFDKINAKTVYARCPKMEGVGLAVYNRLVRAAAFKIINLEG